MKRILYCSLITVLVFFVFACKPKTNDAQYSFDSINVFTNDDAKSGKLSPEILWKFGRIGEYELLPDGKEVIYTIRRYNVKENKGYTDIFKIPVSGGQAVNLTNSIESEFNPKWNENSKKIGYLSPKSGSTQIWEMDTDGSNAKQVSDVKGDINSFEYSPDDKSILYTMRVKTDTSVLDKYPDLDKANAIEATDLMYRHWDAWTDYSHSHVFVATYNNGALTGNKDIMEGEPFDSPMGPYFQNEDISWSPDGKYIAYTCKKLKGRDYALSTNSDIYLYSIETGKTTNITEGMPGYDRFPVFSPNGKMITWQSMATPSYESDKNRLFISSITGEGKKDLTQNFDQSVSNVLWANDSIIYFISGIHATFQVYMQNTNTLEIAQKTSGYHDYTGIDRQNNILVGSKMSFSKATELYRIDDDGTEAEITYANKNIYDAIKMGKVEEHWIKTVDNKKMLVWLIFPPDFDSTKKYPALLYCQGGPQDAVSQFFSYRWNLQLMAANGYVIIAPNRRGLPTFGQEWNDQISGDYGGLNMKDYLAAVDEFKKQPYVDAERIGAVGASYGGYSVMYLTGIHQKRFKAFIAHCGIFNFEAQYAETEEVFFPNHDLGGPFWQKQKPKSYNYSPHLYVQNWDTPIMLITGGNDFRISYTQSLQAFNAAQLKGIPSKLLFFPEESHWVMKPQNSILWQREFFAWLDKWLK
jgi:dipeptidyl aminopeptidase/acylaminoacyl peptidase